MTDGKDVVAVGIGAVVVVVLQLVVAPNIAVFSIVPNFVLAYVVVVALVRAEVCGLVLPFVLGLLLNLAGGGPVGGWALLFTLATFALSRAFPLFSNGTLFMPLALLVVSTLMAEVAYGVIMLASGMSAGVLEALVYRSLPCALYDCVIGLVLYPVALRLIAPRVAQQPGMSLIS